MAVNKSSSDSNSRKFSERMAAPSVRAEVSLVDVIKAFQREIGQLREHVGSIDRRSARYDRAFENMFREELEKRIDPASTSSTQGAIGCISDLDDLKWKLRALEAKEIRRAAR
jgi:hypothetical protein